MKIGIFSKIEMLGGSERRCIELATGISEFTEHEAHIFAEGDIPKNVMSLINTDKIGVHSNTFVKSKSSSLKAFEEMDKIVVINTDFKEITHIDYWHGKSHRHNKEVRLKDATFLFNFIVSPSRHLYTLKENGTNVKIITANSKFFNEITKQDRYELIRDIPRIKLESPISIHSVDFPKPKRKNKITFGMHSKGLGNKWNEEWDKVIKRVNQRLGESNIDFIFMGMNANVIKKIDKIRNVKIYKENELSIRDYLNQIDVFAFFPDWKREEPWARVVGEAMMSGCPILATEKGGNLDQVIHGNNGFLFKKSDDLFRHIVFLAEHPGYITTLGNNSRRIALDFDTEKVVHKLIDFISKE